MLGHDDIGEGESFGIPMSPRGLDDLVQRHGGVLRGGAAGIVRRLSPIEFARSGDLAPLFAARYLEDARRALARGAVLLVTEELAEARADVSALPAWVHPHAVWALASMLDLADAPATAPVIDPSAKIAPSAVLYPRVRVGRNVVIEAGAVIGAPGFGFTAGPDGAPRDVPQLGGVLLEDGVHVGPLCTIASGTLGPTILRSGVLLDAQVHVAHNCRIGRGTVIAAQCGLAGSVVVGERVRMGGQVGIADHLRIGDGAQIAAKSGVIGDLAAGVVVAGYPATPRPRWLRGLAELYRLAARRGAPKDDGARASIPPPPSLPPEARPIQGGEGGRWSMVPGPSSTPNSTPKLRPEAIIRRSERPKPDTDR